MGLSLIVNRVRFTEDARLPLEDSCPVGAAIALLHDKVLNRDLALTYKVKELDPSRAGGLVGDVRERVRDEVFATIRHTRDEKA